jgi:hypothetical protein
MRHESDWWLGGFLIGFITGFLLGFGYTRLVPLRPTPAQLDQHDRAIYLTLIAAAYRHDGDLAKAQRRLETLEEPDIEQTIIALANQSITLNADVRDIRSLATLANALGETPGALLVYLITPTPIPSPTSTPTETPSPTPTHTPTPIPPTETSAPTPENSPTPTILPAGNPTFTPRPTPTPGLNAPFGLAQSIALCDNSANGILRVYIRDRNGEGVPGVEVIVSWPGGQDRFYTGFKSNTDAGYADFQMDADEVYQVELPGLPATVATAVNEAAATPCSNLPNGVRPSWQVVFQQGAGQ